MRARTHNLEGRGAQSHNRDQKERTQSTQMGKLSSFGCGSGIWTSRPSGYEPDELPDCSIPRYMVPEAGVEPVREINLTGF